MDLKSTGKTKEEIKEMYNKYFYETFQRFDFIAEKGEDDYVIDETGKRYLDFMAGIAVNSAGHCNKKVVEAIMEQCQQMMHASNYCYTIPMVMLAQRICDAIGMEKIYFQNSGAEANEVMIKLARKYGKDNFVVIGFPANNFLNQEPGSNEEIKEFCTLNYGVTFPMMEKISVKGKDIAPLYKWLTTKSENGVQDAKVGWNFHKFLIDENGKWVASYGSTTDPLSEKIVSWIEE